MTRTMRVIVLVLVLALGWQLGAITQQQRQHEELTRVTNQQSPLSQSGAIANNPEKEIQLDMFWKVWNLLLQNYIEPGKLQNKKLLYGAISGMVRAVDDPYTVFMTPKENGDFHDALSGKLEGIGAELSQREDSIVVVAPLKGSPAQRVGLMPEDVIISVDDWSAERQTLQDVVTRIRGTKGTVVMLKVMRKGANDLLTFKITREAIHIPSVESKTIPSAKGPIGYVSLNQFGDESIDELKAEFASMKQQGATSFILDLRFNGGGYLDGAVDLVSLFLRDGTVVSVQRRTGKPEVHEVSGRVVYADIPLVVLVNQGTASASEITAGALQDYNRATIVGKTTFGKGTVQEVIDLSDGSSVKITVARWLTPKGKDLGKEGVHPDIEVDRTQEDFTANRDPQLDAAVEWITTGKKPAVSSSSSVSSKSK